MIVARTGSELDAALSDARATGRSIALVPTMGALHAGHLALVRAARAAADLVVVSIFVNPRQFGDSADLERYPIDHARDLAVLAPERVDVVWLPSVADVYADGSATTVSVGGPALGFEGDMRPGHFDGVATVVTILLAAVRPDAAWFGEKDWQQLQVVRRLVHDLRLAVVVHGVATIRDEDGLPLSSRNRFLDTDARARAAGLHTRLRAVADELANGVDAAAVLARGHATLTAAGCRPDYLALVDGATVLPLPRPTAGARLLCAVRVGDVRLLDNMAILERSDEAATSA